MTKILMLVAMIATLAGCTPLTPKDCQKKSALDSCSYKRSGKVTDKDIYGEQASGIKKALDAALTKPHAWSGKRCNVHLDFNMDGTLQNFIIKSGDKDYCRALAEASRQAKFPSFTNQHVYDDMGSARWEMHGQP
ncbi:MULTISPECIES: cell envelope integrity TolA C-terminal domain-containing protein [Enterobacter]|jgi:colicin import membrane protein|uniref:cell envelope integrity TolA C-terminal domain-containing protein n=1 Tax=Enterobacter TaxID=547 RepID=UPI000D34FFBD|nr:MULTISPECIES: cell envelope integrity TolA C-terminal domain-containing protein [Enterobacter]MBA7753056.1 tolA family protein [Enterobacter sp. RHBSTW-01064]MBT1882191.1 tolA family protein [Enterobacter mori]MBT2103186.1 tolA family protein [Enterobacter mori]MCO7363360.1 tolA family protein [Enterobacter mori]MCU3988348.1 tolA family protein [Enterobacter mori]